MFGINGASLLTIVCLTVANFISENAWAWLGLLALIRIFEFILVIQMILVAKPYGSNNEDSLTSDSSKSDPKITTSLSDYKNEELTETQYIDDQ